MISAILTTTSPLSLNAFQFTTNYSLIVNILFLVFQKIVTEKSALCFDSRSFYPSVKLLNRKLMKNWNALASKKNRKATSLMASMTFSTLFRTMSSWVKMTIFSSLTLSFSSSIPVALKPTIAFHRGQPVD